MLDVIVAAAAAAIVVPVVSGGLVRWLPASRRATRLAEARRRRAALADAPAWQVIEHPVEPLCRAVGRLEAEPAALLEAPLTGRRCVHFWVVADLVGPPTRIKVADRRAGAQALVRGAGVAAIAVGEAEVVAPFDHEALVRDPGAATARARALIGDRVLEDVDGSFITGVSVREAVLLPGDEVVVEGAVLRETDPAGTGFAGYREGAGTRLRFVPTELGPATLRLRGR